MKRRNPGVNLDFKPRFHDGSVFTPEAANKVWDFDPRSIFKTREGFVLVEVVETVDGRRLQPWEFSHDLVPHEERGTRCRKWRTAKRITMEEALRISVNDLLPEEFAGIILEALTSPRRIRDGLSADDKTMLAKRVQDAADGMTTEQMQWTASAWEFMATEISRLKKVGKRTVNRDEPRRGAVNRVSDETDSAIKTRSNRGGQLTVEAP